MSRALVVLALALCAACVERRLWVRTDPPGARVRINGEEVGPSPLHWRFHHYGTVLVEVELEGYRPIQKVVRLASPWYQKPGVDFFADVLWPARIHDDHHLKLRLRREKKLGDKAVARQVNALAGRAGKLREEAAGE